MAVGITWLPATAAAALDITLSDPLVTVSALPEGCAPLEYAGLATGSIQVAGQVDCFAVTGGRGDQLWIRIVKTSGIIGPEKRVVRPDGTEVCGWSMARESTCVLDTAGTHLIRVQDHYGEAPGKYTITLQRLNDPVGCSVLPYGQTFSDELAVAGEANCWVFSGVGGKVVRIKTKGTYGTVNVETEVIRPNGTIECANGAAFERLCTLDVTGTHILLTKDNPGTGYGKFNLTLECDTSLCAVAHFLDFDADGKTDISTYRPSTSGWYVRTTAPLDLPWGTIGDVPVPADYDGDGKTDFAVYRPATAQWFVQRSSGGSLVQQWGSLGDTPVAADYDGDGKADFAVYRPSSAFWFVRNSSTGTNTILNWGDGPNDVPVTGDWDGDGKADIAVYRPSNANWFVRNSSNGSLTSLNWGSPGDVPVPSDYDGDAKTDFAVYRPSNAFWFVRNSSNGSLTSLNWGAPPNDVPVIGDFDGDGKTDFAVYRPSSAFWFVRNSSNGSLTSLNWGLPGDVPIGRPPTL